MQKPILSAHFQSRKPSSVRLAQIEFAKRADGVAAVDVAIGNVSLPMHPAMQKRMFALDSADSPFRNGVVEYTDTVGFSETHDAFRNVIAASGFSTEGLKVQVTDGGSQAMELVILGCGGPAGSGESPLLLIDAAYVNYKTLAVRTGRSVVSVTRTLGDDGKYQMPDMSVIRETIRKHKPGAMVVIPYDNPTGHFLDRETFVELAKLCVEENLWMVSDEAYRELYYVEKPVSSIWAVTEAEVPGIAGRRISIESASKVWNACGLRVGALVTDNAEFHQKTVAESTANLCANAIGQYVFGALAHESHAAMREWFAVQRNYYKGILDRLVADFHRLMPGIVVSSPDASIYAVVDVRRIAKPGFDANEFVLFCTREGVTEVGGERLTLLVAPMSGFYNSKPGESNPGKTQMRIALVEPPDRMALVPTLFEALFRRFEAKRGV